jgi:hypothetical protein
MNRSQLFLPTLALFIFGLGHQSLIYAQASGVAPPVATGQYAPMITPQLTILVQNLDQTTAQGISQITDARKQLITQFYSQPANSQDAYLADLAKLMMDALTNPAGPPPVRARMEFAIIANDLGSSSHNLVFVPLVTQLVGDSADPVVHWAEKAAGKILQDALTNDPTGPTTTALVQQIIASIGSSGHASTPMAAQIADSAIKSLILFSGNGMPAPILPPASLSAQANYIMDLEKARISLYMTGVPESPYSDSFTATVLLDPAKWATFTAAQQMRSVQEASDLISVIGQRYGQGTHGGQNSEMLHGMKTEADSLRAMEQALFNNKPLDDALAAVHNLNVGSQPATVATAGQNVYAALLATPKFSTLTPPPTVQPPATVPGAAPLAPTAQGH